MVYLKYMGRPLCDHMGCAAGRRFCEDLAIGSCSYRTRREARAILKRSNATPWAGSLSIADGVCPRVQELS